MMHTAIPTTYNEVFWYYMDNGYGSYQSFILADAWKRRTGS